MDSPIGTRLAASGNDTPVRTRFTASGQRLTDSVPRRRSRRHPRHDYSQPGAYFVTICTAQRRHLFGQVNFNSVDLSGLGQLAADQLLAIEQHYLNVKLDAWVVMPNHVHSIFKIFDPKHFLPDGRAISDSLASIVGNFKAGVTRDARRLQLIDPALQIWQPRFYDHIVRHEKALERVREYIVNNPLKWHLDRENPDRTGINDFYRWLEHYSALVEG